MTGPVLVPLGPVWWRVYRDQADQCLAALGGLGDGLRIHVREAPFRRQPNNETGVQWTLVHTDDTYRDMNPIAIGWVGGTDEDARTLALTEATEAAAAWFRGQDR